MVEGWGSPVDSLTAGTQTLSLLSGFWPSHSQQAHFDQELRVGSAAGWFLAFWVTAYFFRIFNFPIIKYSALGHPEPCAADTFWFKEDDIFPGLQGLNTMLGLGSWEAKGLRLLSWVFFIQVTGRESWVQQSSLESSLSFFLPVNLVSFETSTDRQLTDKVLTPSCILPYKLSCLCLTITLHSPFKGNYSCPSPWGLGGTESKSPAPIHTRGYVASWGPVWGVP